MRYYLNSMANFAEFEGRATRAEFWWFISIASLLELVAWLIDATMSFVAQPPTNMGPFQLTITILHMWPAFAVSARRLHDTGRSGAWVLCWISVVGGIIPLAISLHPGIAGENDYGPDPIAEFPRYVPPLKEAASYSSTRPHRSPIIAGEIDRLVKLRQSGNLTAAEFEALKSKTITRASGNA